MAILGVWIVDMARPPLGPSIYLIFVFIFSICWELYDLSRGVGFDWKDILFDLLGCGMIQLTHYSVHWWE